MGGPSGFIDDCVAAPWRQRGVRAGRALPDDRWPWRPHARRSRTRAGGAYRRVAGATRPLANIPYYCRNEGLLKISRNNDSDSDVAHFLYCGQIVARKGVDLLIRAFCRVAQGYPGVCLTLVGDGPMRAELTAAVPELIQPRVKWAGFREVEDLPPYFAEANVFVLPSIHDGWGVVINQAVSAGMAVIASDAVGAGVDLVTDGKNGLIFPSQNEMALEKTLRFFAENPDAIVRFGRMSRLVGQNLTPEHGAERWYRFLEQILQKKHGSPMRSRKET